MNIRKGQMNEKIQVFITEFWLHKLVNFVDGKAYVSLGISTTMSNSWKYNLLVHAALVNTDTIQAKDRIPEKGGG